MTGDASREHWRRLWLPLIISLVINVVLCSALVRLSATAPAEETRIAVELDGVRPLPPPPPPKTLLKRLFEPKPEPAKIEPTTAQPPVKTPPKPSLFQQIGNIFHPAAQPPAPIIQPAPVEPKQAPPPQPVDPVKPQPEPVQPDPPAPAPEPVKTDPTPVKGPVETPAPPIISQGTGGEPGGGTNKHPAVETPSPGGAQNGTGDGHDGHGTSAVTIDNGVHPGSTNNTGPGEVVNKGNGSDHQGNGDGTGKDPANGNNTGPEKNGNTDAGPGTGTGPGHGTSRAARITRQSKPAYPPGARDEGIEGTVQLSVSLDTEGKVTDAKVIRSAGDRRLDRAAEADVRKWTFEAKMEDGVAMPSTIKVKVVFQLE